MSRKSCRELITELNENDVLCGRGGRINSYPGNVQFRRFCRDYHSVYISDETKKTDKIKITSTIISAIRNMSPSGRFLEEDPQQNGWFEIDDEKAKRKTGQAMRECRPEKNDVQRSPQEYYDALSTTIEPVAFNPKDEPKKQSVQAEVGHDSNLYFNADNSNYTQFMRSQTNTVTSSVFASQGDRKRKKFHLMKMEQSFNYPFSESTSSKR